VSTDEAGPLSVPDSDVEAGRDTEPDTEPPEWDPDAEGLPVADPAEASRSALARARKAARDKGFRPGMKPAPNSRRIAGMPPTRSTGDDRDPRASGCAVGATVARTAAGPPTSPWARSWVGGPRSSGAEIAGHVRPVTFEGTVLSVQADSTAWATQIRLLTSSLLGRIEAVVGAGNRHPTSSCSGRRPRRGSRAADACRAPGPRDTYG
jgi:predicted nucleic acid-binding Zn ribbon protein